MNKKKFKEEVSREAKHFRIKKLLEVAEKIKNRNAEKLESDILLNWIRRYGENAF